MIGSKINNLGKEEKNSKIKEGPCIFPFEYKWKTHTECFPTEKGDICATEVSKRNTLKKYGYCNLNKVTKKKTLKKKLIIVDKLPSMKSKSPSLKSKSPSIKSKSPSIKSKSPSIKSKSPSIKTKSPSIKSKSASPSQLIKSPETPKTPSLPNTPTPMSLINSINSYIKKDSPIIEMESQIIKKEQIYNEEFIEILGELHKYMMKKGEVMRARAYQKAQETIMNITDDITRIEQLKGKKAIGPTILSKLDEFIKTGKINALEKEKQNPIHIFTEVYGIGPKKAKELVEQGFTSIEALKKEADKVLNDTQKIGLQYYEDILKRIPRSEIDNYYEIFKNQFESIKKDGDAMEIVGSYRRNAKHSGDIDVILTGPSSDLLKTFVSKLSDEGIIKYKLTDGKTKILVICQLTGEPARRVDFLYSNPQEFPFAILYFTGSKTFNTVMRQRALDMGYTLNEHGLYEMVNGKKGEKVDHDFKTEKDIFDFLQMKYIEPSERKDGRSVILVEGAIQKTKTLLDKPILNKTIKKPIVKKITEKEHIDKFQKEGIDYIKSLNEKTLAKIIQFANKEYYNSEIPVLSDNEFDIIKEYVESKYPKNKVLLEVGAPVEKNKVELPFEMWSMDKIKPSSDALDKWLQKYNNPKEYVLSAKLDGVSGLFVNGDVPKLYTRGNGKVGQDISHLIPFFDLPLDEKEIVIRGEFMISKTNFGEHFQGRSNPRNLVAGFINKKNADPKEMQYVDFVAYEIIKPIVTPREQFLKLEKLNVKVAKYEFTDDLNNNLLSAKLLSWRENYDYTIDGIIVTHNKLYPRQSGNPEHSFAFKMVMSDQVAEAKVVDVIWTPSKDGYLKPKIRIEPIELGGVKIEYATAFNGAFVENNKLGIGSVVKLVRSGDVIPHILEVTEGSSQAKMPTEDFNWNPTHVDIILENKEDNQTVQEKNISGFFVSVGVDGLGPGNIKRIIKAGYNTVPKIIAMSEQDFLKIEGFKEKLAHKIFTNIHKQLDTISLPKLMNATNLLGRGMGEKRIKLILDSYPSILTDNSTSEEKIKELLKMKGMAKKSADLFVSNISKFKLFLEEANLSDKLNEPVQQTKIQLDSSHPLFQKKIVLTGFRNKELEQHITDKGGEIGSSVSKKTFALIVKSKDDDSGKVTEAKKHDIPIYTQEEFENLYLSNSIS